MSLQYRFPKYPYTTSKSANLHSLPKRYCRPCLVASPVRLRCTMSSIYTVHVNNAEQHCEIVPYRPRAATICLTNFTSYDCNPPCYPPPTHSLPLPPPPPPPPPSFPQYPYSCPPHHHCCKKCHKKSKFCFFWSWPKQTRRMTKFKVLMLTLLVGLNLGILITLVLLFKRMNKLNEVLVSSEFYYYVQELELGRKVPSGTR